MHPLNQTFELPIDLSDHLQQLYEQHKHRRKEIISHIVQMSDGFQNQSTTPWGSETFQLAYQLYFMPLNYLRFCALNQRLDHLGFWNNCTSLVDIGSGPGTFSLSMGHQPAIQSCFNLEVSETAISIHKTFLKHYPKNFKSAWGSDFSKILSDQKPTTTAVFSYSFNELDALPKFIDDFHSVLFIEPSTHQASRKLLEVRRSLLQKSYSIWGPCTHQGDCPLLETKKDFCHDRAFIKMPDWWVKCIEAHLPMKNSSVTFSYLAAKKSEAPEFLNSKARIIGDTQKQKGKTLQMLCYDNERRFLAWMKKNKNEQFIPRGALIDKNIRAEQKGNELRVLTQNILF